MYRHYKTLIIITLLIFPQLALSDGVSQINELTKQMQDMEKQTRTLINCSLLLLIT
jgi:hypothetical protein